MLNLIHQRTNIVRNRIHSQSIQSTIKHVRLDTHFVERFTESTYCQIGVLACHQVHLFKSATIGFHSGETAHINNCRGNAFQLILTRLELTRTLLRNGNISIFTEPMNSVSVIFPRGSISNSGFIRRMRNRLFAAGFAGNSDLPMMP